MLDGSHTFVCAGADAFPLTSPARFWGRILGRGFTTEQAALAQKWWGRMSFLFIKNRMSV